ncbi:TetR/AcrR family transcriptional regulator [Nocardia sp. NPDC057227]|uniref:TetR/AcrR family transcriptional regulator n=1 Tax=Nocardia sp. NPDC057227 TaxID=3346056 RepID=UPI00363634FD
MAGTKGGRPRSDRAHLAILEATRDLVSERGYEGVTIEAIAAAAGVGRQTVYRWWSSKAAVVTEAVTTGVLAPEAAAPADTGDVLRDVRTWWSENQQAARDPELAAMLRGLAAAAAESTTDAERLYERITGPLERALVARLDTAVRAGQLRPDAEIAAAAEALIATLLYRLLTTAEREPGAGLVDMLLSGMLAAPSADAAERVASDNET